MIILAFSSFEKFNFLRVENLTMIDNDFSVSFLKGKTYRELRYGVIPSKDFDPANIFSIYLDILALLHEEGNSKNIFDHFVGKNHCFWSKMVINEGKFNNKC